MPAPVSSITNFARLTDHQKRAWSMKFWKNGRNKSFLTRLTGASQDSVVQRITELKKSTKGTMAVITLVPDALGDGVAGDRTLEGNEEQLRSFEETIRVDQLRHAHRNEGRMADQKTIVNFRKEASNTLGYWLARTQDQLGILTLSGIDYDKNVDGSDRVGSDLPYLEYAADVKEPSPNRWFRWDATTGLEQATDTSAVVPADIITYDTFLALKRAAQEQYLRPVRGDMGTELFHAILPPRAMEHLKKDAKFHAAVRDAMPRTPNSPLFKGFDTVFIDGIAIHTQRWTYNTLGASTGNKWGAAGDVDGTRMLFMGAQALAFADLGAPYWEEKEYDYKNAMGISAGKIFGYKKPQFYSDLTGEVEDFGVMVCDLAI